MGDLPYVEWLARHYLERGETSRCWSDYLKVTLYSDSQLIVIVIMVDLPYVEWLAINNLEREEKPPDVGLTILR